MLQSAAEFQEKCRKALPDKLLGVPSGEVYRSKIIFRQHPEALALGLYFDEVQARGIVYLQPRCLTKQACRGTWNIQAKAWGGPGGCPQRTVAIEAPLASYWCGRNYSLPRDQGSRARGFPSFCKFAERIIPWYASYITLCFNLYGLPGNI